MEIVIGGRAVGEKLTDDPRVTMVSATGSTNLRPYLSLDGTVTEVLPDGNFRVKLDNDHEVLAYTAGKMRKFRIRTGVGDRVI